MDVIKITNVMWLPKLATRIAELSKKIRQFTILPETLYTHFTNIVQFGGKSAEFWVVMDKGKPLAFCSFAVRGLPHTGLVSMDFIYNWSKKRDAVRLLVDEFIEFGKKHRCRYYEGLAVNEKTRDIFKNYSEEIDFKFKECELKGFTCWKG